MKTLAFIGAGTWATPYALSAKHAGLEIAGIYTPDTSAARLAERTGCSVANDPRQLMDMCDCVLIGSPSDTHTEYLRMAAEAGKPALCASPLFSSLEDGDKAATHLPAEGYASFPLRARPEYLRLKKAVSQGELGNIGMIRLGVCRPKPSGWRAEERRSGGMLMETGLHLLDALTWLAGPIDRIYGAANASDNKQYELIVAKMADGSIAHLEISWAEPDGISYDYYEVAGSNGLLEYDSRREPLLVVDYHDERPSDVLSPGATAAEHELRALANGLKGLPCELATLAEGLETGRLALRLKAAIDAGEVLKVSR